MYSQLESQKIVDSYFEQLQQIKLIKISDLFMGREKSGVTLNTAVDTSSQIARNISTLSDQEKAGAKKYLQDKINDLDTNLLSRLSKIGSQEEVPGFVYFVVGSILAFCFVDFLHIPFLLVLLVSLGLIASLMFSLFSNSKNRYLYDYLLKLFER